jgi:Protein of unknown function (DUF3667)
VNAGEGCRNCGADLAGRYCSNCGQPADVHVPSTRELIHEVLEGLTHSDSRLWNTLKCLWFRPGRLTEEFIVGRRAAYLPPFRLYLILSVAFFLLASVSHLNGQPVIIESGHRTTEADCADGAMNIFNLASNPEWNQRLQRACINILRADSTSLLHASVALMSKAMFVLVPLIAFLHMLMYWWPRHRYAVHLLFFLHLQAFFFFSATLLALSGDAADKWPALAPVDAAASTLLVGWIVIYSVVAMRRVFHLSWWLTLIKALLLFAVYLLMLALTVSGVFIYSALQL